MSLSLSMLSLERLQWDVAAAHEMPFQRACAKKSLRDLFCAMEQCMDTFVSPSPP